MVVFFFLLLLLKCECLSGFSDTDAQRHRFSQPDEINAPGQTSSLWLVACQLTTQPPGPSARHF